MWLSIGDLGGVHVGSPSIGLNISGEPSTTPASAGFDWKKIFQSPYFYAAIIIGLVILAKRKK